MQCLQTTQDRPHLTICQKKVFPINRSLADYGKLNRGTRLRPNTTYNAETAVLNCKFEVKMNRYIYFTVKKIK